MRQRFSDFPLATQHQPEVGGGVRLVCIGVERPPEAGFRLAEAAQFNQHTAETVVGHGVAGVKAQGFAQTCFSVRSPVLRVEGDSEGPVGQRVSRVQFERPPKTEFCLSGLELLQQNVAEHNVAFCVAAAQRERTPVTLTRPTFCENDV